MAKLGGPRDVQRPGATETPRLLTADERRLVEFVLWELRAGDLPADVKEAALRLDYPRPARFRRYTSGPLLVTGFPSDEAHVLERRKAWPHQAGPIVQEMLREGCAYVLVQDV